MADFDGFLHGPLGGFSRCPIGYTKPRTEYQYAGLYMPEDSLDALAPVEDYTGVPYDRQTPAPADPGYAVVEERLRAELESDAYAELNQKLEFEVATPNVCDPVDANVCNPPETDGEQERRCELGDRGTGADPDPTRSIDENDPALYEARDSFMRMTQAGGQAATALKYGWTAPHAKKEWKGWGWRHVTAKHGWRPDDVTATAAALQDIPVPDASSLIYEGPEYEKGRRDMCPARGSRPDGGDRPSRARAKRDHHLVRTLRQGSPMRYAPDPVQHEREVLELVKRNLAASTTLGDMGGTHVPTIIHDVRLEGEYPDTSS